MLTVLFVCTGNICRSPLAEGFLADRSRRLLDGRVLARSAGTWARGGDPPMPESVLVARERGVDISDQRCRPLTRDEVWEADLVVAMAEEHRQEVLRLDAEAAMCTFTLPELTSILAAMPPAGRASEAEARSRIALANTRRAPEHRGEIRDPLGLGLQTYREVGEEIEAGVDALVEGLFGVAEGRQAAEA